VAWLGASLLLGLVAVGCNGKQATVPEVSAASSNSETPRWIHQSTPPAKVAVVFVHGLFGTTPGAWTNANGARFFDREWFAGTLEAGPVNGYSRLPLKPCLPVEAKVWLSASPSRAALSFKVLTHRGKIRKLAGHHSFERRSTFEHRSAVRTSDPGVSALWNR